MTTSPTPEARLGAINRWIALLDQAEHLMASADPHDRYAMHHVSRAIDSLYLYEHQMAPASRQHARERLWQRDHPDTPLPEMTRRAEWAQCRCRSCAASRVIARAAAFAPDGQVTTWQAQLAVMHRQTTSTKRKIS